MTLERILQAAVNSLGQGKRKAHCSSAADGGVRAAQCEAENFGFAREYGERGYDQPEKGIVFANWNHFPRDLDKVLERAGYQVEWSDEWIISYETGKAYRTSPDSYGWKSYYVLTEGGDVIGGDEIESGDQAEWYVEEYLLNNYRRANVFKVDLAQHGFKLAFPDQYDRESGLRESGTDKPEEEYKKAREAFPEHDVVFEITDVDQFEIRWRAWVRPNAELQEAIERAEQRRADHIDGYDRDDIGESPDY